MGRCTKIICVYPDCFALDALRRREPDVTIRMHLRYLTGLTKYYFNVYCQKLNLEPLMENFMGVYLNDL